ncbi:MAG: glutamate--tRNA ligase, partial [Pseudomonadota bacterium]
QTLVEQVLPRLDTEADTGLLLKAMPVLKPRAKNLNELAETSAFLFAERPLEITEKAAKLLDDDGRTRLSQVSAALAKENDWTIEALEATTKTLAEAQGLGLGKFAQPMRAALTGTTTSPGIFDVLVLLGRDEALARLDAQTA